MKREGSLRRSRQPSVETIRRASGVTQETLSRKESDAAKGVTIQEISLKEAESLENTQIPEDFDYKGISGLSNEIVQKLETVRPTTLAQAGRISGVTPAAVQLVMMMIKKHKKIKQLA